VGRITIKPRANEEILYRMGHFGLFILVDYEKKALPLFYITLSVFI
jgi:hypothetical protein